MCACVQMYNRKRLIKLFFVCLFVCFLRGWIWGVFRLLLCFFNFMPVFHHCVLVMLCQEWILKVFFSALPLVESMWHVTFRYWYEWYLRLKWGNDESSQNCLLTILNNSTAIFRKVKFRFWHSQSYYVYDWTGLNVRGLPPQLIWS